MEPQASLGRYPSVPEGDGAHPSHGPSETAGLRCLLRALPMSPARYRGWPKSCTIETMAAWYLRWGAESKHVLLNGSERWCEMDFIHLVRSFGSCMRGLLLFHRGAP